MLLRGCSLALVDEPRGRHTNVSLLSVSRQLLLQQYSTLSIHLLLPCFAIANRATVNIHVIVFVYIKCFHVLGKFLRGGIAGSDG